MDNKKRHHYTFVHFTEFEIDIGYHNRKAILA